MTWNSRNQLAFILNLKQHWFTLRRFGPSDDSGKGHWYNLDSSLRGPEWVGKMYLWMVIQQMEAEGMYSLLHTVTCVTDISATRNPAKLVVRIYYLSARHLAEPGEGSASSRLKVRMCTGTVRSTTDHGHVDIIEEIISEEIVDETDRYEDNQSKKRARRLKNASVMRG